MILEEDEDLGGPDAPPMTGDVTSAKLPPVVKVRDFVASSYAPLPELFDQQLAMAEYETRMREQPRITPISGKTLHRLLELGCITEAEANGDVEKTDAANGISGDAEGEANRRPKKKRFPVRVSSLFLNSSC